MTADRFSVAMVPAVFADDHDGTALTGVMRNAAERGAELAVLPELPLNPWSPASRTPRDDDAELAGGPRHRRLAAAARDAGIGLVGGAIVVDDSSGVRHNTALVFDARGVLVQRYRKVHLPQEEGFFEQDHYEAGEDPPARCDAFRMPIGLQICSDANRPTGSLVLGALGVELIAVPRATERATFERWLPVLRANALTACCYVVTVNRPDAERGVGLGGHSVVIGPDGELVAETDDLTVIAELDRQAVAGARTRYPGYLREPAELYSRAWRSVAESRAPAAHSRRPEDGSSNDAADR